MISNAGISRSGRVRKKSAKLIEMEDWDSGEGENYNKPRKKSKSFDDSDPDTERKVAPIRIPKPPFSLASNQKKKSGENIIATNKVLPMKIISREGTAMEVKVLSSSSSESSESSSDESDSDDVGYPRAPTLAMNMQTHDKLKNKPPPKPMHFKKVEVEKLNTHSANEESSDFSGSGDESEGDTNDHSFVIAETVSLPKKTKIITKIKQDNKEKPKNLKQPKPSEDIDDSPVKKNTYSANEESSDFSGSGDESEGDTNDHSLVIAETVSLPKKKKIITKIKQDIIKEKPKILKRPKPSETEDLDDAPIKKVEQKPKKREPVKKGKKNESKPSRPMTAYMLWGQENRKKIVSQHPEMDFANISRKMGEAWKSLPDKEKMAWKRKAKKAAHKGSTLISTGRPNHGHAKFISKSNIANTNKLDDSARGLNHESFRTVGTTSLDVAAHLKLLGESLSIIGQRLTEHEGQIAVSGSLSVLLDSTLCALGPLLCLTSQLPESNGCSQDTLSHILDNVAYMMPGL